MEQSEDVVLKGIIMSIIYEEIGGGRIGDVTYSFPFVKVLLTEQELIINYPLKNKICFRREDIESIDVYVGLIGKGLQIRHNLSSVEQHVVFWCDIKRLLRILIKNGWLSVRSENIEDCLLEDFLAPEQKNRYRLTSIIRAYQAILLLCVISFPVGMLLIYGGLENVLEPFSVNVVGSCFLFCLIVPGTLSIINIAFVQKKIFTRFSTVSSSVVCFLMPISTLFACLAVANLLTLSKDGDKQKNSTVNKLAKLKILSLFYYCAGAVCFLLIPTGSFYLWSKYIENIKSYDVAVIAVICVLLFILILLLIMFSVGFIVCGHAVAKRKYYYFTVFMAAILALLSPLGTCASIVILITLLNKNIKREFFRISSK